MELSGAQGLVENAERALTLSSDGWRECPMGAVVGHVAVLVYVPSAHRNPLTRLPTFNEILQGNTSFRSSRDTTQLLTQRVG